MRISAFLAALAIPAALVAQSPLRSRGYFVLPEPRTVELQTGDLTIGEQWRLDSDSTFEAAFLRDELQSRFNLRLSDGGTEGTVRLSIAPGSVEAGEKADIAEQA